MPTELTQYNRESSFIKTYQLTSQEVSSTLGVYGTLLPIVLNNVSKTTMKYLRDINFITAATKVDFDFGSDPLRNLHRYSKMVDIKLRRDFPCFYENQMDSPYTRIRRVRTHIFLKVPYTPLLQRYLRYVNYRLNPLDFDKEIYQSYIFQENSISYVYIGVTYAPGYAERPSSGDYVINEYLYLLHTKELLQILKTLLRYGFTSTITE